MQSLQPEPTWHDAFPRWYRVLFRLLFFLRRPAPSSAPHPTRRDTRTARAGSQLQLRKVLKNMAITFVQTQVTKAATFVGAGVSIAGIVGDWTIKARAFGDDVSGTGASLTAGQYARISIEESPDNFTTVLPLWTFEFSGGLPKEGISLSVRKQDLRKTSLFGTAGAKVRANLNVISATSNLTYEVWIDS
jgi:hypothetical protein